MGVQGSGCSVLKAALSQSPVDRREEKALLQGADQLAGSTDGGGGPQGRHSGILRSEPLCEPLGSLQLSKPPRPQRHHHKAREVGWATSPCSSLRMVASNSPPPGLPCSPSGQDLLLPEESAPWPPMHGVTCLSPALGLWYPPRHTSPHWPVTDPPGRPWPQSPSSSAAALPPSHTLKLGITPTAARCPHTSHCLGPPQARLPAQDPSPAHALPLHPCAHSSLPGTQRPARQEPTGTTGFSHRSLGQSVHRDGK